MKSKQIQLEKIVSSLKMRFDVEPRIENNSIVIDAGSLSIGELGKLQKFCEHRAYEMEVQKSVTFKIKVL